MNIPTLTKGFLRSMGPSLGVATLKNRESEATSSELSSVEEGGNVHDCSDWTSVVNESDDEKE
jgi:hypothetical protein